MIEDKKPVKSEKMEIVDETDTVRHGYVRKTRSSAWSSRGWRLSLLICTFVKAAKSQRCG